MVAAMAASCSERTFETNHQHTDSDAQNCEAVLKV
jgi:hypothetical protein